MAPPMTPKFRGSWVPVTTDSIKPQSFLPKPKTFFGEDSKLPTNTHDDSGTNNDTIDQKDHANDYARQLQEKQALRKATAAKRRAALEKLRDRMSTKHNLTNKGKPQVLLFRTSVRPAPANDTSAHSEEKSTECDSGLQELSFSTPTKSQKPNYIRPPSSIKKISRGLDELLPFTIDPSDMDFKPYVEEVLLEQQTVSSETSVSSQSEEVPSSLLAFSINVSVFPTQEDEYDNNSIESKHCEDDHATNESVELDSSSTVLHPFTINVKLFPPQDECDDETDEEVIEPPSDTSGMTQVSEGEIELADNNKDEFDSMHTTSTPEYTLSEMKLQAFSLPKLGSFPTQEGMESDDDCGTENNSFADVAKCDVSKVQVEHREEEVRKVHSNKVIQNETSELNHGNADTQSENTECDESSVSELPLRLEPFTISVSQFPDPEGYSSDSSVYSDENDTVTRKQQVNDSDGAFEELNMPSTIQQFTVNTSVFPDRESVQDEESDQDKESDQDDESDQGKESVQDEESGQDEESVQGKESDQDDEAIHSEKTDQSEEPASKSDSQFPEPPPNILAPFTIDVGTTPTEE